MVTELNQCHCPAVLLPPPSRRRRCWRSRERRSAQTGLPPHTPCVPRRADGAGGAGAHSRRLLPGAWPAAVHACQRCRRRSRLSSPDMSPALPLFLPALHCPPAAGVRPARQHTQGPPLSGAPRRRPCPTYRPRLAGAPMPRTRSAACGAWCRPALLTLHHCAAEHSMAMQSSCTGMACSAFLIPLAPPPPTPPPPHTHCRRLPHPWASASVAWRGWPVPPP